MRHKELMYNLIRPHLFRLDPERAHELTLHALSLAGNIAPARWFLTQLFKGPSKPVEAFGLTFKNPVGIAAGYDKDGVAIRGLAALAKHGCRCWNCPVTSLQCWNMWLFHFISVTSSHFSRPGLYQRWTLLAPVILSWGPWKHWC